MNCEDIHGRAVRTFTDDCEFDYVEVWLLIRVATYFGIAPSTVELV